MFTGIVEETGKISSIKRGSNSAILSISANKILEDIHIGDSIAVNGICLTVTSFNKQFFSADVMHETIRRSSLSNMDIGAYVNLERAMPIGGRFGGHIVSGHIDGTGEITYIQRDDNAILYTIKAEPKIIRYIVEKGSITIDGMNLTVVSVQEDQFIISAIPHTVDITILKYRKLGDKVNLEVDIVGKYIERFLSDNLKTDNSFVEDRKSTTITREFLHKYNF